MLELFSTDEFTEWFGGLGDADAEEVASALELVEKLGPGTAAPASRESLLWYQCLPGEQTRFSEELLDFTLGVMRLLGHLESQPVRSKLEQLSAERSARASHVLACAHARIRGVRAMARLAMPHEAERALHEVQRDCGEVLALIGAPAPPAAAHSRALRELNLRARQPGMRILYGVDVPRARALLVLGEHLVRNAYGPAVRRALAVWQRYLSDDAAHPLIPSRARNL